MGRPMMPRPIKPVLSRAEGPVLSRAEGPVVSAAEGPVLSVVEEPVRLVICLPPGLRATSVREQHFGGSNQQKKRHRPLIFVSDVSIMQTNVRPMTVMG